MKSVSPLSVQVGNEESGAFQTKAKADAHGKGHRLQNAAGDGQGNAEKNEKDEERALPVKMLFCAITMFQFTCSKADRVSIEQFGQTGFPLGECFPLT